MKTYELVNPSDAIIFDAISEKIAFLSVMFLSQRYAARDLETGEIAIGFYFMGISSEEIDKQLGETLDTFVVKNFLDLANALHSFRYKTERSSMNEIVKRAHVLGDQLIKKYGEPNAKP